VVQVEDGLAASSTRLADLGLGDAGDLEGEAHVVGDRHVRVERVVLEDHGDVAVLGGQVGDVAVTDPGCLPLVDFLEAGEHAQRGGLSRTGGTDEDEELAVLDVDVQLLHRGGVSCRDKSRVALSIGDSSHGRLCNFPSPAGTCRTIRCKGVAPAHIGVSGFASMP
jgi:hypothetical protein